MAGAVQWRLLHHNLVRQGVAHACAAVSVALGRQVGDISETLSLFQRKPLLGLANIAESGASSADVSVDYDVSEVVDAILCRDDTETGIDFAQRALADVRRRAASGALPCSSANGGLCATSDGGCVLQHGWTAAMKGKGTAFVRLRFTHTTPMSLAMPTAPPSSESKSAECDSDSDSDEDGSIVDRWIKVDVHRQSGVCELKFGTVGRRCAPFTDAWAELLEVPVTRLPATWTPRQLVGVTATTAKRQPVEIDNARVLFSVEELGVVLRFFLHSVAHARCCAGVTSPHLYDKEYMHLRPFVPLEFHGEDRRQVVGLAESRLMRVNDSVSRPVWARTAVVASTCRHVGCSVLEWVPSSKVSNKTKKTGSGECATCRQWGDNSLKSLVFRQRQRMATTSAVPLPSGEGLHLPDSDAPGVISETLGVRATEVCCTLEDRCDCIVTHTDVSVSRRGMFPSVLRQQTMDVFKKMREAIRHARTMADLSEAERQKLQDKINKLMADSESDRAREIVDKLARRNAELQMKIDDAKVRSPACSRDKNKHAVVTTRLPSYTHVHATNMSTFKNPTRNPNRNYCPTKPSHAGIDCAAEGASQS